MSEFGKEVRRLRTEANLTQAALAQAIGISQGMVGHIESGRKDGVAVETLYALSRVLGVDCRHWEPFFAADVPQPPAKQRKGKAK